MLHHHRWDEETLREWLHSQCLNLTSTAIAALIDHGVYGYRVFEIEKGELNKILLYDTTGAV